MEGKIQYSPKLGYPVDGDDLKYVSGLSTILVATIQEAKDRISQIEYVFCSQLYPNFQSKSKSLQKIYLEAKKEAEDAFRKKENDLLLQIEKLEFEKKEVVMENQSLLAKLSNQQIRNNDLEQDVLEKSKEVDEGIKFHKSLFQMIQSKDSLILEKEKQLEEHEGKINELVVKAKSSEEKVEEVQKLLENSMKRVESLSLKLKDSEQLLSERETEKETLSCTLKCLEDDVNILQENLRKKTEEFEEGRLLQAQLLQQIDVNAMEISKQRQYLEESDNDRKWLLDKVGGLEEKVVLLQQKNLSLSGKEAGRNDSSQQLLEKIELKTSELLAEKKNFKELMDRYKRLKSQYSFLLAKSGLTSENMVPRSRVGEKSGSKHQDSPSLLEQQENKSSDASGAASEGKVKIENELSTDGSGDNNVVKSVPNSSFNSPTSGYIQPKCPPIAKSAPVIGIKRPASSWIETRSRECRDGHDPHDDFLATPLENLRTNLNKTVKEEVDFDIPVQNDANVNSSDDETQDMDAVPIPEEQMMPVPVAGKSGFKYVEPVRKKAERENLKGVECKQCKKFYDAVLPDNGGKVTNGGKRSLRCEHHDGVSRHRYKYAPPLTPEGFWNIGFESEM